MARGNESAPTDWVTRAADDVVRHAGATDLLTVASGASPSGPIHLGNLREFLTPHFVAEELRGRGLAVRHLHSWDDYDRFRKVPVGVPPEWAEHIGRPLSAVPDPWDCHSSWAEHFKAPLRAALAEMGVQMEEIDQTQMYRSGAYRAQILRAVERRDDIEKVLAQHRTKAPVAETDQEAAALADSVALDEEPGSGDLARFPFKAWCGSCGRDTTTATSYDDDAHRLAYTCSVCGYTGSTDLADEDGGKLVWKVDWPMRWAYERVDFEPAGLDHMTPGSSYTVGRELVSSIFDWRPPARVTYAFVGFAGVQKMSSSSGGVPTGADALRILEAPILRWLYVRRAPKQAFDIDFGPQVVRLYDEWDALTRKAGDPDKRDAAVLAYERASATTTAGTLPTSPVVVPFRVLASVADVTAGSAEQISRIVGDLGHAHDSVADLEPRLSKAMHWTEEFVPVEDRTLVRTEPDAARLAALSERESTWLTLLLDHLGEADDLDAVTSLVYGVPKLALGQSLDEPPTDEVKADQKDFFGLLYHLLVGAERGPRLPTLIMALGTDRVRALLGG